MSDSARLLSAQTAFRSYTQYRVNLLSQQLAGLFVTAAASGLQKHKKGQGSSLIRVVQNHVEGIDAMNTNANGFGTTTLGHALVTTTSSTNTSAASAALDSLAQGDAIQAARIAEING